MNRSSMDRVRAVKYNMLLTAVSSVTGSLGGSRNMYDTQNQIVHVHFSGLECRGLVRYP
jgi:hypothetical protein